MALRWIVESLRAPEPDGQAAVCKTAEAGSTPAGASTSNSPQHRPRSHIEQSAVRGCSWPLRLPREGLRLLRERLSAGCPAGRPFRGQDPRGRAFGYESQLAVIPRPRPRGGLRVSKSQD